jgi:hypothetical protein
MKLFATLITILLVTQVHFAQTNTCEKWAVQDFIFQAKENVAAPFEVDMKAIFQHESGQNVEIKGFYNDDNTWVVRFSPKLEGKWIYQTTSELTSLNNKKGQLLVIPASKNQHGAIQVNKENTQRFVYEDGTPYFAMGFEIDWLFALDAENKENIPKTRQITQHLADNGFNQAIMNVYAYDAIWGEKNKINPKYNFANPKVFPFGGTNDNPNHQTLNADFFKHLDRVIAHLDEKEIVAHLMIYVWNKKVNWATPRSKEDNRYFDYVVKRYQAYPNIVWDISKEALAHGMDDMNYIVERIERLRKLDTHQRLVTVHDYDFCKVYPNLIDFISVQEWRPNLYNEMLNIIEAHPRMPILNVEHGGYEKTMHSIFNGAFVDSLVCLERNYICLFSGTYSTYYWQNSSWYELVYEPFALPKANQPNFHHYKIMMDFFSNYDYAKFIPTQYFYSPYCLTDNEKTFIYLLPPHMFALEGNAPPQAKNKNVEVQWFNPLTGEYTEKTQRKLNHWTGFRKPQQIGTHFSIAILTLLED